MAVARSNSRRKCKVGSRYWVGGSGTWDSVATTHWAASSGGAAGESAPTSTDDVFLDANSGGGTITLGSQAVCQSCDMTGLASTFADGGNAWSINGSLTLASGMTFTGAGGDLRMEASGTITSNGVTMPMNFVLVAGTTTLADAATFSGTICSIAASSTLDLNGQTFANTGSTGPSVSGTLTCGASTASMVKLTINSGGTLNFNSAVVSITGTGTVVSVDAGATINAGTGTLKITNSSASSKTLSLQGKTYPNLWLAHGSTGTVTIQGSNTFADYKITSTTGAVLHTAGTTQTVSTITWDGTAGNLITVRSSSNGSAWNISKSSGTVTVTYCSIRDSAAAGGATFTAESSVNVSGNTGWIFRTIGMLGFGRLLPF